MTIKYLQLEFTSGLMYEYSKEDKEGFEKHTSSKGNVSYRDYYKKGVTGQLDNIALNDGKIGRQLQVVLKDSDEDTLYICQFNLTDQKGNVDSNFVESIIRFLPNLEKGIEYTIFPYNFTPDDSKYSKTGVSFKTNGEKVEPALTYTYKKDGEIVDGDIPMIEWKEDALGKYKPTAVSLEKKNDFLMGVVAEQLKRLPRENDNSSSSSNSTSSESKQKEAKQKKESYESESSEDEYDDLPF